MYELKLPCNIEGTAYRLSKRNNITHWKVLEYRIRPHHTIMAYCKEVDTKHFNWVNTKHLYNTLEEAEIKLQERLNKINA